MRDFSFAIFKNLVSKFLEAGYAFQTLQDYVQNPLPKVVLIRHDVDVFAESALRFAKVESKLGIRATYYFRTIPLVFKPVIIRNVASLGHEIGYHYEDLSRANGDLAEAVREFSFNLNKFRALYPVKTACMHGSSSSPHDNRTIWESVKLGDFGLLAEPYLSLDFSQMLYLTDTSQSWNGSKVSLRDKVDSTKFGIFRTTDDIIHKMPMLPDNIMITMHPEYWTFSLPGWLASKLVFTLYNLYKSAYRNKRVKLTSQQVQKHKHKHY